MVFFLNPPSVKGNTIQIKEKNLHIIDYGGFNKGFKFFPKFIRAYINRKMISQWEKYHDINFDIIWSFDNSVFFDLDVYRNKITISHIVDFNMDYQFSRASQSADICFSNTKFILKKQRKYNLKSFWINHGLALNDFTSEFVIPESSNINIGYAGNLEIQYLDWDLIHEAVNRHPDVEFFFAGSYQEKKMHQSNTHMLGKLSKSKLWEFYKKMDAFIIAYKADEYPEQLANPHKILEYLYTGKEVVATYTAEYDNESNLLLMSNKNSEWLGLIADLIDRLKKNPGDNLNEKQKKYALENTYDKQIDRIEEFIIQSQLHE